ncbi:hypothetical protein DS2_15939 [Catenovulum agarivorans DS-2]|uniref:MSHA biogenesis protein MshI n=1 Tax=Catenovulum agarivorans DS-2 TaxID=1328313 RepID=W7QTI4_9ALTE|nr:PilN domain-containing protein [Catenovulum agarivorans]EWH08740.1 hypothetical protein DS2_15939 [Catenovulum agarivorans DS-2]
MKRDINLYLEEFHPKPDPLSLGKISSVWLILLLSLSAIAWWVNSLAATTSAEYNKVSQAIALQQSLVDEFESALANRAEDPALKDTIVNLSREISQKQAVKNLVESRQQTGFQFSPLMADLANYHHTGIWLETIVYQNKQIVLKGGSSKVSTIPQWLAGLSQSDYFIGKTFKDLTLNASANGLYTQFSVATNKLSETDSLAGQL